MGVFGDMIIFAWSKLPTHLGSRCCITVLLNVLLIRAERNEQRKQLEIVDEPSQEQDLSSV